VEPSGVTEFISLQSADKIGSDSAPPSQELFGDRGCGRAVRRERSVASMSSGEASIAAADLHGT